MTALAVERPVLRLRVEAFSERPDDLKAVAHACRDAGFSPAHERRSYTRTAWIDLTPTEDELLASFHKTARQNIRAPGKKGLEVRDIVDPSAAHRVEDILQQSFRRTGAVAPRIDWEQLIRHASTATSAVHIAGLFRTDDPSSVEPLSFAVAYLHGDVAEYAHAGSVRDPSTKVSLLYVVAWELMRWAKRRGASSWDFGGVTEASDEDAGDGLSGITDFKRYFSKTVCDVGQEWVLEPRRGVSAKLRSVFSTWPGL